MAEVGDHPRDRLAVVGEDRTDASVEAGSPDARPERDATVARGPEVADREARVGDRLAAGPAQLGQAIGDRLGDDHVAAPGEDPGPEAGPACRPGVHREHGPVRRDGSARGLQVHAARPRLHPLDGRSLVDLDPALQQDAAQPPCQERRLDGRGTRHEEALAEHG